MQKHLMPLSLLFKSDALSFGWTSWHNSCRHYLAKRERIAAAALAATAAEEAEELREAKAAKAV